MSPVYNSFRMIFKIQGFQKIIQSLSSELKLIPTKIKLKELELLKDLEGRGKGVFGGILDKVRNLVHNFIVHMQLC